MYICIYICIYINVFIFIYLCIYIYNCLYEHKYIHIYTYFHMLIQVCIYIYLYIFIQSSLFSSTNKFSLPLPRSNAAVCLLLGHALSAPCAAAPRFPPAFSPTVSQLLQVAPTAAASRSRARARARGVPALHGAFPFSLSAQCGADPAASLPPPRASARRGRWCARSQFARMFSIPQVQHFLFVNWQSLRAAASWFALPPAAPSVALSLHGFVCVRVSV